MTKKVLKQEKYLFLASAGQYQDKENAYPLFVETVESIISSEHNKFRNVINEARRPSKDKPEDHGSKFTFSIRLSNKADSEMKQK